VDVLLVLRCQQLEHWRQALVHKMAAARWAKVNSCEGCEPGQRDTARAREAQPDCAQEYLDETRPICLRHGANDADQHLLRVQARVDVGGAL
jgi:hypothetical protein